MNRPIKLLPDELINRIAAGEVVERPATVLKELVENSLDAGADRLEIEIHSGGKRLIRVRDNGRGMGPDDLLLSIERHATSKLELNDDLSRIVTLGFRGEALASIGAVSKMTITSAPEGEPAHFLKLFGGKLLEMAETSANRGTTIEVKDLFYNVPARKKFLRTEATESGHLLSMAHRYALSRADLSLSYSENGREVFSVESRHDFKTRVFRILGRTAAENLNPFSYELPEGEIKIHGWLTSPEHLLRNPGQLFLYVLGRPVKDRLLMRALREGYGRLLPPSSWPAAIIFIELPPEDVDVNVHPAKTEVRFRKAEQMFSALSRAVSQAVGTAPIQGGTWAQRSVSPLIEGEGPGLLPSVAPAFTQVPEANLPPWLKVTDDLPPWMKPEVAGPTSSASAPGGEAEQVLSANEKPIANGELIVNGESALKEPSDHARLLASPPQAKEEQIESIPTSAETNKVVTERTPLYSAKTDGRGEEAYNFEELQALAQIYQSYILAQGTKGLYLIDQHAGHERILFNQLKKRLDDGLPGQALLFPDTMDLPPKEAAAAENLQPHLERLGFELEHFGERTFILKSAPAILKDHDPWPPLLEILGSGGDNWSFLENAGLTEALERMAKSWLYSLACRAAIKAGDKLTLPAMQALIDDMRLAEHGAYCPHGRPAIQLIERSTIERRFAR